MSKKLVLVPGQKFGKITVIEEGEYRSGTTWKCRCECGKETTPTGHRLMTGQARSCGCMFLSTESRLKSAKSHMNKDAGWNQVLNQYKQNAKKRGLAFSFSLEELKQYCSQNCHYCGEPPQECRTYYDALASLRKVKGTKTSADSSHRIIFMTGIDRIDSTLGYSKENCVPCCRTCNVAKSAYPEEHFRAWIRKAYLHQNPVDSVPSI